MLAGALEAIDLTVYDHLFEWRGPRPITSPIVIAAIDGDSIRALGAWPFPRAVHAKAVDTMARVEARVIGFDIIFDIPSARGPTDDEALGAAIAGARNVVLAAAAFVDVQPMYVRQGFLVPIPPIRHGARALGSVTVSGEHLGRRTTIRDTWLTADGVRFSAPTFAAQIARLSPGAAASTPGREQRDSLINFRGRPGTFRRISYHRLVRDTVPTRELRGAIVLVGTVDSAVPDFVRTPFARDGTMPGVELHANAVETLRRGNAIREVPIVVSAIVTVLAGLVVGALVAWRSGRAVEGTAVAFALMVGATLAAFAYSDVWFRAVGPGLSLAAGLILSIVARKSPTRRSA